MKKTQPEMQIERLLTVWGIIVVVWSFFRAYTHVPLWVSEIIVKPLVFIGPVYFYYRRFEKQGSFLRSIGLKCKNMKREAVVSIFVLITLVIFGYVFLSSNYSFILSGFNVQWFSLGSVFIISAATAISEEIIGRGFLFHYLYTYSKNIFVSFVLSVLLFFILYLPGVLTSGAAGSVLLLSFALNIIMSTITVILYRLRGSLFLPIAVHAAILLWFDLFLL